MLQIVPYWVAVNGVWPEMHRYGRDRLQARTRRRILNAIDC